MNAPGGWIPAYRRMFDPTHDLWRDEPICPPMAWLDLCQMAATGPYVKRSGRTAVRLERGELLVSLRFMAKRWNWSVKKVRNFLEYLGTPEVTRLQALRGTAGGTVYRVVNYDAYALAGHTQGHTNGTAPGHSKGHREGTGRAQSREVYTASPSREVEVADVENSALAEWGVSAEAVDALRQLQGTHTATDAGIVGQWGPGGTMESRWGDVPEERRPALVGAAIFRTASDSPSWRSSFFASVLERCIQQELSPTPEQQAKAQLSKTPVGKMTSQEEERREADRRAAARARRTKRDMEEADREEEAQEARIEKARQFAAGLAEDELEGLRVAVRARLESMGPAAKVPGMQQHAWIEVVEEAMSGNTQTKGA